MLKLNLKNFNNLITLLLLCNVANYSFATYTYSGRLLPSVINQIFIITRFLLAFVPAIYIVLGDVKIFSLKSSFGRNWDMISLGIFTLISSVVNGSFLSLIYGVWFLSILVVAIFWLSLQFNLPLRNKMLVLSKVLFYSNIIVFLLLMLNISELFNQDFRMPFTSKNFYAFSLYILVVGAGFMFYSFKNTPQYISSSMSLNKSANLIFVFFIVLCIAFISVSGRRSSLIMSLMFFVGIFFLLSRNTRYYIFVAVSILSFQFISKTNWTDLSTIKRLQLVRVENYEIVEDGYSNSYGERKLIWESYIEIIRDNPFCGVGLGNAQKAHSGYFPNSQISGYSPHNSYLALVVENGIIGAVLLVIALLRNARFFFHITGGYRLLYALFCLGLFFICFFEYNSSPGQILFWPILLAILWPRHVRVWRK